MSGAVHTPGLEYPREWFRVSNYGGPIEARMFIRETDKMLVFRDLRGREARDAKSTTWSRWFPTREEAEAALASIRAKEDQKAAARRLGDAAPSLLEALQAVDEMFSRPGSINKQTVRDKVRAAIARAKGETQ